jgi:hypothetical protein
MRTTIRIDDGLLAEAKLRAARTGKTLTAVVDDALRVAFAQRDRGESDAAPALPILKGGRLLPGVDLDDSAALLEVMEGAER